MSDNTAKEVRRISVADETAELFWSKVKIMLPSECWEWTCGKTPRGYGAFGLNGRQIRAHRVAYALSHESAPAGILVLHKCDNPPCCNPLHLFLGTSKDNTQDMMTKGRNRFKPGDPSIFNIGKWRAEHMPFIGSSHPHSMLNEAKVLRIKALIRDGVKGVEIARQFGCSTYTVSLIKTGKQWRHV